MIEYPVVEIAPTIQGEGYWTGIPVILLRLAGCNMRSVCDAEFGCDTDYSKSERMSVDDIVDQIESCSQGVRTVLLTGGEPTIHPLLALTSAINAAGFAIHLETNGSNAIGRALDSIRWITVSPKTPEVNIEAFNELKMLVRPDGTIFPCEPENLRTRFVSAKRCLDRVLSCPHELISLQPMWGKTDPRTVVEKCLERGYRLSAQLHKYIGLI